jgi:TorA maturation chaperone TorD
MSKDGTFHMSARFTKKDREYLLGETLLIGLIGRIIYQYPESEQRAWFQSLIDSGAFAETPIATKPGDMAAGLDLLQKWSHAGITDEIYSEMQSDHLRLFIGAGKIIAPPWESAFCNEARLTFQEQTLQVRNWYRRFGLEPEKIYHEPDDHIGLELTFMAHLANQALLAIDKGDKVKFDELIEARKQFLNEHLLKWAFAWCDLVTKNARTDFYKGMALLTRGTIAHLAEHYELQFTNEVVG